MLARRDVEGGTRIRILEASGVARLVATAAAGMILGAGVWPLPSTAAEPVSFQRQVFPIIKTHCLGCHRRGGEGYLASGLGMETYAELMRGTRHGPIIVPGSALVSNFNVAVEGRANPSIRMPFHRPRLRPVLLRILRRWVDQGAADN
jgi:hypothetical protein